MIKIAAATAAFSLIAGSAFAQSTAGNTASADGAASTTVIQAITISATAPLAFGTIVKPAAGSGLVTVAANGSRTAAAPVVVAPGSAAATAAAFSVTGATGQAFSITTPGTVTLSDGTDNLTVNLVASGTSGTLTSGTASFTVGGNMTIADTTVAGAYTGNFTETVTYN